MAPEVATQVTLPDSKPGLTSTCVPPPPAVTVRVSGAVCVLPPPVPVIVRL